MENQWKINGKSMENQWKFNGKSMEIKLGKISEKSKEKPASLCSNSSFSRFL